MSRSFDAAKYVYNQTAGQAPMVSQFMNGSLDAARNAVLAAKNQSIVIDGAGIHIGGDSNYQMRIIDSMIAMTDDNWQTAKVAIGHFASPDIGEYWGVNAEVIGGKLICGNNLVIENANDTGVMQFKVDSSGAWLYNSTFILASDGPMPAMLSPDSPMPIAASGGKIILDPRYGIVAGNGDLFTTNGTTVTPSFVGGGGQIQKDDKGMPTNSNFFLDIRDGSAYFRGTVHATAGDIGGFTIADSYLYSGSGGNRVAMNGGQSYYGSYAFWAGAENPDLAKFWVKKNGDMSAKNAIFQGTITGANLQGNITATPNADGSSGWLVGCGINVNNKKFYVDPQGNCTLAGDINMSASGKITWNSNYPPVKYQYSINGRSGWHDWMNDTDMYRRDSLDGGQTYGDPYQFRGTDGSDAEVTYDKIIEELQNASSVKTSYINADSAGFPVLYGGEIYGAKIYAGGEGKTKGGQVIGLTSDGIDLYDGKGNKILEFRQTIQSQQDIGRGGCEMNIPNNAILELNASCVIVSKIGGAGERNDPLMVWNFPSNNIVLGGTTVSCDGLTFSGWTYFNGRADFSDCTVTGLSTTATYA